MNIEEALSALLKERPIFHSEADFQHAFAWKIKELHPHAKIRLEFPFYVTNNKLVGNPKAIGKVKKRKHLDIRIEQGNLVYAIELKYKKKKLTICNDNELFELTSDSAYDQGAYDFLKDVNRLEEFVKINPGVIGYAIMLTNADLYWKENSKDIYYKDFLLSDKRKLTNGIELDWQAGTANGTKKGREKLKLNNDYLLTWKNYSNLEKENSNFKYLIIEVPPKSSI